MEKLKPCPFCGGKAKVSFRDYKFFGKNCFGDIKLKYRVQVICNRCKARGKVVITDWMVNPSPYARPEEFSEYVKRAIEGWNIRL